ncbi:MAG TPA: transcriptional repressor [Anaerolineaceae bacterium]|nr:transcriptional repressor [Anaerolineaceae bacterium]
MRASSVDQAILDTLSQGHSHLTSHEVYEQIRDRLPAVNQSTVYRSLDRLVSNGRLSVSDMGTGAAVYELVSDQRHHHLVCQKCGKVVTIADVEVQEFFSTLESSHLYKITTNHLVLFGLCAKCQKNDE